MTARILDGNVLAQKLRADFKMRAEALAAQGERPGLAVILVGEDAASQVYVRNKVKACDAAGFHSENIIFPADVAQHAVLDRIAELNADPKIHGILVQLPLPRHFDTDAVLEAISPAKDVDGFHVENVGALMQGQPRFIPCTPYGVMKFFEDAGIDLKGKEAVVIGRSNIVGKPIANIMLQKGRGANSTVTIVHTGTKNLDVHCKRADILIVAAGVPGLVKPEWIKPGACVIDVGVNRVGEKLSEKTGKMIPILKGDVDFDAAKEIAGAITPVPGGVGPMTITMLMKNTVKSAKLAAGI